MPDLPLLIPQMQPKAVDESVSLEKPLEPKNLEIKPIDFDKIKEVKPGKNENIKIIATSSSSQHSNVDGVENSSGSSHTMVNVNGDVKQETVQFGKNTTEEEKPKEEKKPSNDQKPQEPKTTKEPKLGKFSKLRKLTKANDIKSDDKPKEERKPKEVQTESDDKKSGDTVDDKPDENKDNHEN